MTRRFHGIRWLKQVNPSIVYIILLGIIVFPPVLESPELIQAKQEHSFSFSLADDNCVSVECVKEKMQTFCEKDSPERPVFINCYLILRCLDFSEMTQTTCASGGDSYTSQSLRLTWVVLEGCTTQECIMKCRLEPLPAPPECVRSVLL